MFDFTAIYNHTENPTFVTILFTVLFSFLLSSLIVFTYEKTTRDVARPDDFLQAMVLIAIVSATIMQAIGDSVARGLGMLGALAIIRFRTTVKNPRNIVFMFASIATGIACGVYGFVIAITGTLGFCAVAFILRFTPFSRPNNLVGLLDIELPHDSDDFEQIQQLLKKYGERSTIVKYKIISAGKKKNMVAYQYKLKLEKVENGWHLVNQMKALAEVQTVNLSFEHKADEI